jgi:hypothetical protein
MLNIEIYIDTCEDQAPSASVKDEAEQLLQSSKQGEKHPIQRIFSAWRASSEDRQLRIIEMNDGR